MSVVKMTEGGIEISSDVEILRTERGTFPDYDLAQRYRTWLKARLTSPVHQHGEPSIRQRWAGERRARGVRRGCRLLRLPLRPRVGCLP